MDLAGSANFSNLFFNNVLSFHTAGIYEDTWTYTVPVPTTLIGAITVGFFGDFKGTGDGVDASTFFDATADGAADARDNTCTVATTRTPIPDGFAVSGQCTAKFTFHSPGTVTILLQGAVRRDLSPTFTSATGSFEFDPTFSITGISLETADGTPLDVSQFKTTSGVLVTPHGLVDQISVPEPSMWITTAVALLGIVLQLRKRERRRQAV